MPATIKFRAYSEKYGKMVYPNDPEYRIEIGNDGVHRVWKGEGDDEGVVVMLHSGLTDQYVVDIYDGDIVRSGLDEISIVVFKNGAFWTKHPSREAYSLLGVVNYPYRTETTVKHKTVIGNIHENPELIEN